MEKKIIIVLLLVLLNSCTNISNNISNLPTVYYDTIFFTSEISMNQNANAFLVENADIDNKFILLQSKVEGNTVWIDSLLFEKKGLRTFFIIARVPTQGYHILYYNGDSLIDKIIGNNFPRIDSNLLDTNFFEISINDSLFNSGYLNYLSYNFKLTKNCILVSNKDSFSRTVAPK